MHADRTVAVASIEHTTAVAIDSIPTTARRIADLDPTATT